MKSQALFSSIFSKDIKHLQLHGMLATRPVLYSGAPHFLRFFIL